MAKCILCGAKATVNIQENASRSIYNCNSCGVFVLSDLSVNEAKQHCCELAAYFASRKLAGHNEIVLISFENAAKDKDYVQLTVRQIVDQMPRSFGALTDRVLVNLARLSGYAGDEVKVDSLEMAPLFYVQKISYDAMSFIIKAMQKMELVEANYFSSSFFPCGVQITPKGWDRLSRVQEGDNRDDTLLVYLPAEESANFKAYRSAAQKAAKECGFLVREVAGGDAARSITHQLVADTKNANFVVCSLSSGSGGAYYTAGMAAALGKHTVLTCHQASLDSLQVDREQFSVLSWKDEQELYLKLVNAIRALV